MPCSALSTPALLIAIGGLSGTGKSTLAASLARLIAPTNSTLVLRSDVERKALFGVVGTTRLDASAYTFDVTRLVYEQLSIKAGAALAKQETVIIDAVFADPAARASIEQVAHAQAGNFLGLWLEVATSTARDRVAGRINDVSDATPEIIARQSKYDPGVLDWHRIDAGGTPAETLAIARHVLRV